jgi:hypothetical protein
VAKTVTPQLLAELQQQATNLCRLFKIVITLPAAATPLKTLRVTDHDKDILFTEETGTAVSYAPLFTAVAPYGNRVGSQLNVTNSIGPVTPAVGDILLFYIEHSWGVTPTTSQPSFTVTDDAGNTWTNLGEVFDGTGTVGGNFISQVGLSVWRATSNGNPISHITTLSSVVPGAFDVQGSGIFLQYRLPTYISASFQSKVILANTTTPTMNAFTPSTPVLVVADIVSAKSFTIDSLGAGYLSTGGGASEYIAGAPGTYQPAYVISGLATSYPHLVMGAVVFSVNAQPTITALYKAAGGFSSTAVEHKSDASPDNLEITHFLDSDLIDESDLRAGLYDFADITLCVVSWRHPEYGPLKVIKGTLGQVSLKNGLASTEVRGLTQKLSTNLAGTFGPTCRAELFDGKLSTGDNVAFPGTPWRCRKDPTAYTAARSVASSPDAITIVPNTALPTPSFTANQGTAITLNGQPVTAKFYTHGAGAHGAFDLQFGGTVGNPEYFGSTSHPGVQASGSGNSINFNGGDEYSSVPVISPLNWAVIDNGGHVLSWSQPWVDATENYDMIAYGQLNIPAAGNYTFNVAHDDGCLFAMIPDVSHPNDVVTVVSGPVCPPLNQPTNPLNQTLTAYNGYSFGQYHDYVGGTGDHGSGSRYVAGNNKQGNNVDQWTIHFPAAGVYLFEFGWTNFEHRQRLWVTVQGQANDILPSNLGSGTNPVSGWYENGLVRFTSGALKDWTFDIQELDVSGNIKLFAGNPMPYAPQPGDTFTVQTGCNKLTSDCFYKYGNVVNFQGENAMPGNFVLLQTPDLK